MDSISRIFTASSSGLFPQDLRDQLLSQNPPPLIFEEDLPASTKFVENTSSTTSKTARAGICITAEHRLVVITGGKKKMDIPLRDPAYLWGFRRIPDKKEDRVKLETFLSFSTVAFNPLFIVRIKTKRADEINAIVDDGIKAAKEAKAEAANNQARQQQAQAKQHEEQWQKYLAQFSPEEQQRLSMQRLSQQQQQLQQQLHNSYIYAASRPGIYTPLIYPSQPPPAQVAPPPQPPPPFTYNFGP